MRNSRHFSVEPSGNVYSTSSASESECVSVRVPEVKKCNHLNRFFRGADEWMAKVKLKSSTNEMLIERLELSILLLSRS